MGYIYFVYLIFNRMLIIRQTHKKSTTNLCGLQDPKYHIFFYSFFFFFQFVENLRTLILCCNVDIISIIESDVNFKLIVDVCAWRTETPFADALYSHLNRHSLHKTHTKKERKRYTPLISCVCTRCAMGRRLSTCQLVLCSEHSMHSMLKFS